MFFQRVARLEQAVSSNDTLLGYEAHSGDEEEYKNDAAGYEEDGSHSLCFRVAYVCFVRFRGDRRG